MNNNTIKLLESGILQCPRCGGELQSGRKISCSSCTYEYPILDTIPVLTPEPEKTVGLWQNLLHNFFNIQQRNMQLNKQLIESSSLYPPLRERLKTVNHARAENLETIMDLFLPLRDLGQGIAPDNSSGNIGSFILLVSLLRDWGWDTDEVDILCNTVIESLPADLSLDSLLVIGSGACRDSFNLHNHYNCKLTVSIDIAPLTLLGAYRIVSGDRLDIHQILPNNIRSADDHVNLWELKAPYKPANDFLFAFADATQMPFRENAFQAVLTPFIIDAIGEDLRTFAKKIHRLLQPGGYWANYGAMLFNPGISYTSEEVLSIVEDAGFRILTHGFSTKPHLAPRESCQRNVFDCLYFSAVKQ